MEKTTAQTLLEKMGLNLKNQITLDVNGVEFTFNYDSSAFDDFVNQVDSKNKLTPMKDYLLAIVEPEQRADLLEIIHVPMIAAEITNKVNEALIPKINVKVKN